MVMDRSAGTSSGASTVPPTNTCGSANSGRTSASGSRNLRRPSSTSCMTATEVIGLVIEKIRQRVSPATATAFSRSARPAVERSTTRPWRATSTSVPTM